MSWSIKKKGLAPEILKALKEDPGAAYTPAAVPLLAEEMLGQVKDPVELSTYGHVFEGIGEVHLTISKVEEEMPAPGSGPDGNETPSA